VLAVVGRHQKRHDPAVAEAVLREFAGGGAAEQVGPVGRPARRSHQLSQIVIGTGKDEAEVGIAAEARPSLLHGFGRGINRVGGQRSPAPDVSRHRFASSRASEF
jgi:hypothetical protein